MYGIFRQEINFLLFVLLKKFPTGSPKGTNFPCHVLYVDDVFIFYMANKSTLNNLMQIFHSYSITSRQWLLKVIIILMIIFFPSNIRILGLLGFNRGYLRIHILLGALRTNYLKLLLNNSSQTCFLQR